MGNVVPELEVVVPNWKGPELEGAATLLLVLLLPKENAAVFCCPGFWFAPKVNILVAVLFPLVLVFPKGGVETLGVPNVDGCVPNGESLLLSPNVTMPLALPAVAMPNVEFDEVAAFCPGNVLFGAEELKLVVPLFEAPNTGPAVFSPLNIELPTPKFCEPEFCAPAFPLF